MDPLENNNLYYQAYQCYYQHLKSNLADLDNH